MDEKNALLRSTAQRLTEQSKTDLELRNAIKDDPEAVLLRGSGLNTLPDGVRVAFSEGDDQVYLDVLDQKESGAELSIEDLQPVQGGYDPNLPEFNFTLN